METVQWKVDGMDCYNCAITIHKYLEKQGLENVKVNFANGDVLFDIQEDRPKEKIAEGIKSLGYEVTDTSLDTPEKKRFLSTHFQRFLFCLPFTAVLMLHMIPGVHIHWLTHPLVQLGLTLPVYVVGMSFFGKSA